MGSDITGLRLCTNITISIHAPRVGSDIRYDFGNSGIDYFNPRSPCGERRAADAFGLLSTEISIHAPRVGSDLDDEELKSKIRISIHAPRVGSD